MDGRSVPDALAVQAARASGVEQTSVNQSREAGWRRRR